LASVKVIVLDAVTVGDAGVRVGASATVTVALVASFDSVPLPNKRALQVVAAVGPVNVIVAAVTPLAGIVLESLRYFQST
jgi:hypothetical protein